MTPVPLPTAETVNLVPPDAAEAQTIACGVAAAAAPAGGLLPVQRSLIIAMTPAMTGHAVTLDAGSALSAPEFARALARRELSFRNRMVQYMVLCALLLHPIPEDVAENVASYARELGVEEGMVRVAGEFAHGSLGLAAVDFVRNGYEGTWNEEASSTVVHSSRVLHDAWEFSVNDAELAARWAALEHLPSDSIGRGVWEMYQARGFTFPGAAGSAPPLLAQHDWVHVLGGYGTMVESEVEVFGLIARANDDMHAFSLLAMVISLFETGYLARGAGLFESSPGHFSSDERMAVRLSDAMARGARCHDEVTGSDSIDFLQMDWFAVADQRCEELRERFHLVPKSEAALAAGSVGPWERGGISPFQMNAGRALAEAQGRPYDAHGASLADVD
ncbi:MAG TPA: hypothetical protein VK773_05365 [Acidimicrobiales bacterium]|nr:hypothetical protein [Acidimicrobiales bacterium]